MGRPCNDRQLLYAYWKAVVSPLECSSSCLGHNPPVTLQTDSLILRCNNPLRIAYLVGVPEGNA